MTGVRACNSVKLEAECYAIVAKPRDRVFCFNNVTKTLSFCLTLAACSYALLVISCTNSLPPQYLIIFSMQILHLDWLWQDIHHHWGCRTLCRQRPYSQNTLIPLPAVPESNALVRSKVIRSVSNTLISMEI